MKSFFAVPDKEKNYQGFMVYVLVMIWFVVTAAIVSMGFFLLPKAWLRWLILLGVSLFMAACNLLLNRLGYIRLASWSLTIMLWLYITISCYSAGGIMAPGILMQISIILTAGFLIGWRGALIIGLLTIFTDFGFAYLELTGRLPGPSVIHTPITRWVANIISFGTIIALQYYATNHLRTGLIAMQREMGKREEAERAKDQTLYNLGERVKELRTLYSVSRILQNEDAPYPSLVKEIAAVLPLGWQYPDITAARICIAENEYVTSNYQSSEYNQQTEMKTASGTKVFIEVAYLKPMKELDEGPFLKEERSLINMLVEMLKIDLERRERKDELKDYRYALDIASIVSISEVDGSFSFVNENFCKASKYSSVELVGKHHSIIWSGLHSPAYFEKLKVSMENGFPYRGEFCNKAKDGTLYWVDTSIVPFLDQNGKVYQYLSISHDITRRKETEALLRESEEKFRSIVEQSLAGIYIIQNGKLIYVNPGFEKIFGYSKNQLLNKISFEGLVHEDDIHLVQDMYDNRINKRRVKEQYVFRAIRKDGYVLYIEVIASLITYNNEPAIIGTIVDITGRIEEERRMNEAVLDAQEKERLQIGMELHDNVKQILVGSGMFLDFAQKKLDDKPAVTKILDDLKKYNTDAITELRRLSHQLAPSVEEDTNLDDKIQWLIKSLKIEEHLSISVMIDAFQKPLDNNTQLTFYRILQEQLSNIQKYAAATVVEISIRSENNSILLQVKDNGKGFDVSAKKGGIGLENIRRRVQMLQGKVDIISAPGKGCEVNIQVPLTFNKQGK